MITRELDRRVTQHTFGYPIFFNMKNKKKTKDLDISSSIYKIVLNNVFHFPIFFFFFIDSTDYNSTFTNILKLNIE